MLEPSVGLSCGGVGACACWTGGSYSGCLSGSPFILSLVLALPAGTTALASGDGNMDGGGGGMGSGTATDVWHNQDGVRITVVMMMRGSAVPGLEQE